MGNREPRASKCQLLDAWDRASPSSARTRKRWAGAGVARRAAGNRHPQPL